MRKEFLKELGYDVSPMVPKYRVINEFHVMDDDGSWGADYYILNTHRMDKNPAYRHENVVNGEDIGEVEEKVEIIMSQNRIDIEEYMPHYDYDCSGVCMRRSPIITELYDGRYLVKSSWFVDC